LTKTSLSPKQPIVNGDKHGHRPAGLLHPCEEIETF
jgi:hypothetical protein